MEVGRTAAAGIVGLIVLGSPTHGASWRECRRACRDEIAACVAAGGGRATCRRERVQRCRREGSTVCASDLRGTATAGLRAPASLVATALVPDAIAVAWVDTNSRESGYVLERSLRASAGFEPIATLASGTSFRDGGRAPGTTYHYRARAYGRKGALSPYSEIASATTLPAIDTTPPSTPTGLVAVPASCARVDLSWAAAKDVGGAGVAAYRLYRDGFLVQQVTAATIATSDLTALASTTYDYRLSALDAAGNESAQSDAVRALTPTCATTTTTRPTTTTTTTLGGRTYKAPYADGYIGHYDSATIPLWPARMILMRGEANAQGALIATARQAAVAAGNADAKFIFYLSLTDMDSRCYCFDQGFYDSFRTVHPEWILKDASGNAVTTSNGIGRLYATDIGNPAYVQAWADWAFTAMDRYGWDGTFADNIFRGNFDSWSAPPVNPRTGLRYTVAQYRSDILAALRALRARYDARGKILIGNHTSAWDPSTFADPVVQQEILSMHGVEIEDCVYDFNGNRQSESSWIAQLRYLDYANAHGVKSVCNGPAGTIGDAVKRRYLLASYLLTKEGFSDLGEINSVGKWWPELSIDLGAPLGRFYCLDPSRGLAPATSCPSTGKIYARDWEHGRVLVNPTNGTAVTVPLGETLLNQGTQVTSVTLAPGSGAMLVRP